MVFSPYRRRIPMPALFRNLFIGLCLALLAGCVGYGTAGRVNIQDRDTRVDLAFSDQERHLIHDYYRRNLPPGLAKRSQLPPGLAKRSSLPPGLSGERLPRELESRLSSLPDGYVRFRIGTDVVLMNAQTRVVFDIVKDIGR
jgi:hypothetical protein